VRSLLDVNILIALFQPAHIHAERAHRWWADNSSRGWASCPLTQNGFCRIVSQPKTAGVVSAQDAMLFFDDFASKTDHAFWPDDISLLDVKLFDRGRILGPGQLTDIYLLGLAVKNGSRFATLDQAIPLTAVRGANEGNLVVL
jgi:toxin-antitoxin system PIN domain toxin